MIAIAKKTEKQEYQCMCCLQARREDDFYRSPGTRVWNYSDKRILFCRICLDNLMGEYAKRHGEKTALSIICALIDIPFVPSLYQSVIENNTVFGVGMYTRLLNGRQWQNRSFLHSIIEGELGKSEAQVKEEIASRWSKADKQNMAYAVSVVGYDPFDDCNLTDSDRKYCFNILAGYCDAEGIREDAHKIQSVIQMTQAQLQCRKLDENINQELLKPQSDEKRVKDLTETKNKLLSSISTMAKDNNISSAYNANSSKGANTLSQKMKEMAADDYAAIKVNLFDIKTCEAMRQIADLSNRSISEQLALDANDYGEMLIEQRQLIQQWEERALAAEEEARMLKNRLLDLGAT